MKNMSFNVFTAGTDADATKVNSNFGLLSFGDGSDGAFSSNSGTTTLTQGAVYQYESFSLTGTSILTTTKTTGAPVIILVQGNLTISTSGTVDFKGKGVDSPTGSSFNMYNIISSVPTVYELTTFSNGTQVGDNDSGNAPGGNPPTHSDVLYFYPELNGLRGTFLVCSGTKGGDGATNGGTAGVGGSGGGSILILVGGDATISSTFDFRGDAGTNGTVTGSGQGSSGGGGGGGGSIAILAAGTLTDSGTYLVTGGAAGTGAAGGGSTVGNFESGGSGGASMLKHGANAGMAKFNDNAADGAAGGDGISVRKGSLK